MNATCPCTVVLNREKYKFLLLEQIVWVLRHGTYISQPSLLAALVFPCSLSHVHAYMGLAAGSAGAYLSVHSGVSENV
jgi:hypothetical protein